jgi:TolA-binding protein
MRFQILGLALMASVAMPAAAQRTDSIDRRVNRLEQEMRAVQRRVFPDSESPYVGPEIGGGPPRPLDPAGVPATSAVTDLTERVDSLEGQLRELTGQVEQNSNRMRQMEEAFNRFRESAGSRLEALERPAPTTPEPSPAADEPPPADPPGGAAPVVDPAEAAYNAGFRLWEQKRYADAQRTLEDAAKRYPKSRWASWAANLAGRAYLDGGKPANAAKLFLSNYQANPKGERAADSLFFLGQALMALKKPADACKAYDELQDVYGETIRDYLKQRLPAARTAARCD